MTQGSSFVIIHTVEFRINTMEKQKKVLSDELIEFTEGKHTVDNHSNIVECGFTS